MATHKALQYWQAQAEYPVDRLERPSKILTPYGDTEKNLDS